MHKYYPIVLSLLFFTACVPEVQENNPPVLVGPQRSNDSQAAAVERPVGNVEVTHFISSFAKTCVLHFADNDALTKAFEASGFSISTASPNGNFWRATVKNSDISGVFGEAVGYWSGPDGGGVDIYQTCGIEAELSNPNQIDIALQQLTTPAGETIQLEINQEQPIWRHGIVQNATGRFRVALYHQNSGSFAELSIRMIEPS